MLGATYKLLINSFHGNMIDHLTRYLNSKYTANKNIFGQSMKTPLLQNSEFFGVNGEYIYKNRIDLLILDALKETTISIFGLVKNECKKKRIL